MKQLFVFILLSAYLPAFAQVTGKITDAVSGVPLENALIVSGSEVSVSARDGSFSINAEEYISIEATGYRSIFFQIDTLRSYNIRLQPLVYDLSEVSITAYHTPGKLRSAPGAVSVIPLGRPQAAHYNVISALSTSPGVFVQEATPGTMKLTLRGIGSRYPYGTKKIKMYFDDIPLYSAEGETWFDDINPDYLSRIELLRGPASGIYGASLGGAVVMYPKRSDFGITDLQWSGTAGSFGYLKNNLSFSTGNHQNDVFISATHVRSDGYRENSEYNRKSFLVNYNHTYTSKLSGTLLLIGSQITAMIPSSIDSATFYNSPESAAPHWLRSRGNKTPERILAGYKLTYTPENRWGFDGSVFGTFRRNEENRPFNFLNEEGYAYGTRLLARFAAEPGGYPFRFISGTNLFFERYNSSLSRNISGLGEKGPLLKDGTQFIYQTDLFSMAEIIINNLTISAGFDLNRSGFVFEELFSLADTIDQSGTYHFNPVFSPRLTAAWDLPAGVNIYAAINHGFTIPSLSETQTPLGLINQDIKPEKAWSYETGLRTGLFNNSTFIDLSLYHMRVSDLIVPKRVEEDFYVGMNAGASLHQGIELALQQWLWGKASITGQMPFYGKLDLSYSLNRFEFLDFVEDENDFSGNRLPGMPAQYFNGRFELGTRFGLNSKIEVVSSGRIPMDDFNSIYSSSWTIVNAEIGYDLQLASNLRADASFRINNLTDVHYASMLVVNAPGTPANNRRYYYPGMPRWVTFNIRMGWVFGKGRGE